MALVEVIVGSGRGVLDDEYRYVRFSGDDLLAVCRPRGLPIGNLTSQFWSNCFLHPFDQFVTRGLGCRAYLRYVDDFAPSPYAFKGYRRGLKPDDHALGKVLRAGAFVPAPDVSVPAKKF